MFSKFPTVLTILLIVIPMKIRFLLLCLMFLLVGCNKTSENSKEDFFIAYDNLQTDNNTKERILDSLYGVYSQERNDSTTRKVFLKLASRYEELGLDIKYYNTVNKVQLWASEEKDTLDMARSLWYKGDFYENRQVFDSAFHYYSQSEKLYRLYQKDSLNWGRMLLYKAGTLYDTGIYTESETEVVKAMNIFNRINEHKFMYRANLLMGLNLKELKEYEDALEYFKRALRFLSHLESENYSKDVLNRSYGVCYNNIGTVYEQLGNYEKAIEYYNKGFSIDGLENNPRLYAMLLNNYAHSKMLSGDYSKEVDSLLSLSLKIRDSIGHEQGIIASKLRIGEYYLNTNDTVQALQTFTQAYSLSLENKSLLDVLRSLEFLAQNDKVNKAYYTNRYIIFRDSVREIERTTKNKFARISFETEQIKQENKELLEKNTLLLLLFFGSIVIIITTIRTYNLRLKNRKLRYKQKEQLSTEKIYELLLNEKVVEEEARTQERNRISRELHDGIVNRLFTTRLNLELLESGNDGLKNKLLDELKDTEKHIREVSHDLRNNLFSESKNFNKLVEELVARQKNPYNTKFEVIIDKLIEWNKVSDKQKVHTYRIIQEGLQNVNKYAQATKCFVFLLKRKNKIIIRIYDNGVGFDLQKTKRGLGFKIFEERANELNGELSIKSEKGKGTTIEVVYKKKKT